MLLFAILLRSDERIEAKGLISRQIIVGTEDLSEGILVGWRVFRDMQSSLEFLTEDTLCRR